MTQFGTRILFIGGSYGGLASIKKFISLYIENNATKPIELILLDPRAGFINILGIPLAIIDPKFAAESYLNVENNNIKFNHVETLDPILKNRILKAKTNIKSPDTLKISYIQGSCVSFINKNSINYQLTGSEDFKQLSFDYTVFSTGRKRAWPFDPQGFTQEQFVKEMGTSTAKIEKAKTISIIGAGALGIEIAGEIKAEMPEKNVILIHPHPDIPPEVYAAKNFKVSVEKHIRDLNIDLKLNTRIAKEEENGDLITTTGDVIKSELNFWCNFHSNNIQPFLPVFQDKVELPKGEIKVEETLLVKGLKNIFAIGDVVNLPIIKTAGGAYHQGERVANSLFNILIRNEETYHKVDLKIYPAGMTVVIGRHKSVSQYNNIGDGEIKVNDEDVLGYYHDYCTTSTKNTMNINGEYEEEE
ncbi:hypothetical protein BN7_2529 [Wickerhamomyces ciferrii]|uniref:FAD/NAD(P)-binding domain-containing protein n=1 Tax=Wickerhamomyces ciferrii (strain ATCC 14091 / BCRC 22168 / CBS 111 / JCM 3599 / NBRC 0793 / NRRL Y-1031 F-60-10) TaxID=1206466 RepID=K0KPB6_WICCF|nr:uncharacterized protein BN7_2529 [Wickerhamomyces ciferrii]CCH42983.1 hypothetical protein BN7_2529 [Wickerhamomyces ciferrii]